MLSIKVTAQRLLIIYKIEDNAAHSPMVPKAEELWSVEERPTWFLFMYFCAYLHGKQNYFSV